MAKLSHADKKHLKYEKKTFKTGKKQLRAQKIATATMKKGMKDIIANQEQMANRGWEEARENAKKQIEATKQATREQTDAIAGVQHEIRASTDEITFHLQETVDQLLTLNWEMRVMNNFFKEVSNTLDNILESVAHTEKSWAYAQFQDAMFAYERELYEEALEYVTRAIEGNSGHTGYALDFRFYNLQGVLRLGTGTNVDEKIVDSKKAKEAFLKSARYSFKDYPHEAANAFLCAGKSAFVEGNIREALDYTKDAIEINDQLEDAYFQYGKFLLLSDNKGKAVPLLKQVIIKQPNYALLAAADDDLKPHSEELESLILECSQILKDKTEKLITEIGPQARKLEETKDNFKFDEFKNEIAKRYDRFNNDISYARRMLGTGTLIGTWEAMRKFNELTYRFSHDTLVTANELSTNKIDELAEKVRLELKEMREALANKRVSYNIDRKNTGSTYSKFFGKVVVGAYLLLTISAYAIDSYEAEALYESLYGNDIPLAFGLILGGILALILGKIFGSILGTIVSVIKPRLPKNLLDEEEVLSKIEEEKKQNLKADLKLIDRVKRIGERLYDSLAGEDNEPVERVEAKAYLGKDGGRHLTTAIGIGGSGEVVNIFEKDTAIPVKLKQSFSTTEDNVEKIEIILVEGEALAEEDNEYLCTVVIEGLVKRPKGEAEIGISFNIDKEGYFFVTARDNKFIDNELSVSLKQ